MTMLVMAPTAKRVYNEAIIPHQQGQITNPDQLWDAAKQPLRDFMFDQIDATGNWSSVYMILDYRGIDTSEPDKLSRADVDMVSLIPAFMLSELKTAFLLGFRIYLPFLIIDMVISSLLISMSMMMLPPVMISLPFKLLLFVLVDGWTLVVGGLMRGFRTTPVESAAESASRWPPPDSELWPSLLAHASVGAEHLLHTVALSSHTLLNAAATHSLAAFGGTHAL
jgi:flagellar biosynthetic protein FliP